MTTRKAAPHIVDGVIDSIVSPQTTGRPIPSQIMAAPVVLGYIAGNSWLTFQPYEQARPDLASKGLVIPVSLTAAVPQGTEWCMYDMEKGGGRPENIGFFGARVPRPFLLYTFASAGADMLAWARHFGFRQGEDFFYVSAHANGHQHFCAPDVCGFPRSDWTQYLFAGAYDKSCAYDYALPKQAPPKPVDPYALYPTDVGDPRLPNHGNERLTVEQTDGALEAWRKRGLYHDYLKGQLRGEVKSFRDRCFRIATKEPPDFVKPRAHAVWNDDRHLGARWQGLNNRIKEIDAIK